MSNLGFGAFDDDEFDFSELDAILLEDADTSNMDGKTVGEVLGLQQTNILPQSNSIKHYEVDIDMYQEVHDMSKVIQNSVIQGQKILPVYDILNQDMFLSLFKYKPQVLPETAMKGSSKINNRVIKKIVDTQEYKNLRKNCRLDLYNSALGTEIIGENAVEILRQFKEEIENRKTKNGKTPLELLDDLKKAEDNLDDLEAQKKSIDELIDMLKQQNGQPGEDDIIVDFPVGQIPAGGIPGASQQFIDAANQVGMSLQEAQELADSLSGDMDEFLEQNDDIIDELAGQMAGAYQSADQEVSESNEVIDAWGIGDDTGCARIPFADKKAAVEKIRKSKKLKELTNLIGNFKDSAVQDQKRKSKDGATTIKSVKNGNKLESILPSEKLKLCNKVTKKEFYQKYNQKELLQYELESNKVKSKGPIIVCIDTSGSMEGNPEKWSKAVALAMLEIAHLQKRDYAAIIFSDTADEPIIIEKDKIEPNKIIDIAERFHDSGTNFQRPLEKALKLIEDSRFKKADIVFITDGESGVSSDFLRRFNKVKEDKEFSVKAIVINTGCNISTRTLDTFADEVIMLSKITDLTDSDSDITHSLFSSI